MDFEDLIGFVILLFVFLVPLVRKLLLDKKKVETRVEVEEEELEFEPPPPPPVEVVRRPVTERLVKRDYDFHTDVEEQELETLEAPEFKERIVSDSFVLETKRKRRNEHFIDALVQKRDAGQAMVILSEIFGKPKGLE